jgi:transcriptional regulator with XRE-family HTH domain
MLRYEGRRIRVLRLERAWSIDELAQRARLSVQQCYTLEGGRANPRADTLGRLASALEVPVDTFFVPGDSTGQGA